MKKYLFTAMVMCLSLISCQKDYSVTDGTTPTPGSGGNNGGNTSACNTYQPSTTGTTWTYENNGVTDILTITAPDTTIDGKVFKRISSTIGFASFLREDNGNLYQYADLGFSGQVLLNPLRASANIGDKWTDIFVLNGVKETVEHSMLEKQISLQIDGLQFKDVIHTRYQTRFDFPPIYNNELVGSTDVWYGKCVGVLQTKTVSIMAGVVSDTITSKIKSYTIK